MNYYERHIGDYLKNTAHLSLLEHGVYSRLLDVYYTREAPIPDAEAARLIAARSKDERAALRVVLAEFFELRDGLWHQARADQELQAYAQGEPEREVKRANEDNRLRRHREERAALFKVLTAAGLHAPWNIKIEQLRAMAETVSGAAPATPAPPLPATAPATPATATQYPVPSTQSPYPKDSENGVSPSRPAEPLAPAPVNPPPPPPAPTPAPPAPAPSDAKASPTRGTRLPDDWKLPKGWGAWAQQSYPHWTADTVRLIAEKFRNHWKATSGKAGTKLDWLATWQNWCHSGITQKEHPPPRQITPLRADEPEWARERRERASAAYGPFAAASTTNVIDIEVEHADAPRIAD